MPADININIGANIKQALAKISSLEGAITNFGAQARNQLAAIDDMGFGDAFARDLKQDLGIKNVEDAGSLINDRLAQGFTRNQALSNALQNGFSPKEALAGLTSMGTDFNSITEAVTNTNFRSALDEINLINSELGNVLTNSKVAGSGLEDMGKKGKKATSSLEDSFDAAALGVMFFGMQIQRVFTSLARSGLKTFSDAKARISETATNVEQLGGTFKFLQFSIGEALSPLIPYIMPVVIAIGEFVQENKSLVATFITLGAAIGTTLFAIGALQLGWKALTASLAKGGFLNVIGSKLAAVTSMTWSFTGALKGVAAFLSGIGGIVTAAVAALLAIGYAMATNEKIWKSFKDNILNPIKKQFDKLAKALGIRKGLAGIMAILKKSLDVVATGFAIIGSILVSLVSSAFKTLMSALIAVIELLNGLWKALKSAYNALKAFWRAMKGDFSGAAKAFNKSVSESKRMVDSFKESYNEIVTMDDEVSTSFEFVGDTVSALKEQGGLFGTFETAVAETRQRAETEAVSRIEADVTDEENSAKQDEQIKLQNDINKNLVNLEKRLKELKSQQNGSVMASYNSTR